MYYFFLEYASILVHPSSHQLVHLLIDNLHNYGYVVVVPHRRSRPTVTIKTQYQNEMLHMPVPQKCGSLLVTLASAE